MNKIIIYLIAILKNLFKFSKPEFVSIDYVDYVIDSNAYFLLSWNIKNTVALKIKPTSYTSFKKSASAYIAIPEGINYLEIVISNIWSSKKQIVLLKRLQIASQIDFNITTDFSQATADPVAIGNPSFLSKYLILKQIKAKVTNIDNQKEIINITYP